MAYNPMSGNSFVNAVGSTGTTPVVAAPTVISPQQQAANDLAAMAAQYKATTPDIIKTLTDANDAATLADIQMTNDFAQTTESINQAFTALGVPGYTTLPVMSPTKSLADAQFDIMIGLMSRYNIAGLADSFSTIRKDYPNISSADAMDLLRYDPRYNAGYVQRFAGNQIRAKNGFAMLDEKTYLDMEQGYSQVFKNYGLNTFDNPAQYQTLIGNNVNVAETGQRVSLAYDRVLNADKGTLDAWQKFYPQLGTADLVATMLDPKNQLPMMEKKVQSAEIGGAALSQGLNASLAQSTITANQASRYSNVTSGTIGADAIRNSGETLPQAKQDYQTIAAELPTAEKLSSIYGGRLAQYGQTQAEQNHILGMASENRKLQALSAAETSSFAGSAGTSKGAFSTQYLNRQGKSGAF
jgi:hypothetical protein